MIMQEQFHHHITRNFPFLFKERFLLAISGGIDSVVLAYLCKQENLDFALVHCNFQLRAEKSLEDEKFVRNLAEKLDCRVYVKKFDTKKITKERNESTQMVARDLRYEWFEELCEMEEYSYVLTAHHLNDAIETFFINLLRGTGLEGLTGIPLKNNRIIRPLLNISRQEIQDYAYQNYIKWREDKTNATDNYLRNRIRHHIVPEFEKENANFKSNFYHTQNYLKEANHLIRDYITNLKEELSFKKEELLYFDIAKLKEVPNLKAVLYQLFKDYGFTSWEDIFKLVNTQSGKQVLSKKYRLIKDREYLILGKKKKEKVPAFFIDKGDRVINFPKGMIILENVTKVTSYNNDIAYLGTVKIKFPLKLRTWKPGDTFQPYGMKGHKKVSDFLKDEKLSIFEKENTWVLCSDDTIVWVVGHRINHSFRVKNNLTNILKLEFKK